MVHIVEVKVQCTYFVELEESYEVDNLSTVGKSIEAERRLLDDDPSKNTLFSMSIVSSKYHGKFPRSYKEITNNKGTK